MVGGFGASKPSDAEVVALVADAEVRFTPVPFQRCSLHRRRCAAPLTRSPPRPRRAQVAAAIAAHAAGAPVVQSYKTQVVRLSAYCVAAVAGSGDAVNFAAAARRAAFCSQPLAASLVLCTHSRRWLA